MGHLLQLVKAWAKARNFNDPVDGTFNTYALCLMVRPLSAVCMWLYLGHAGRQLHLPSLVPRGGRDSGIAVSYLVFLVVLAGLQLTCVSALPQGCQLLRKPIYRCLPTLPGWCSLALASGSEWNCQPVSRAVSSTNKGV